MIILDTAMSVGDVARALCSYFKIPGCRTAFSPGTNFDSLVKKIAICAGSGGGIFENAGLDADLLITGEMGHHQVLSACRRGASVCLFEHSNTERGYLSQKFKPMLESALKSHDLDNIQIILSEVDSDPISIATFS